MIGAAGILPGQGGLAFNLDFGAVDLEAELPVKLAVDTSGYTTCRVRMAASDGSTVLQSKVWGTEPNRPNTLESPPPKKKGPYHTIAEMHPTAPRKPSMALALTQDSGVDLQTLGMIADRVRFVKDPATRPSGGHFVVDMPLKCMVRVQIFRGEARRGGPLFEDISDNVGPGPAPVPWNLRTRTGAIVAPGRYLAFLICTPKDSRRRPTRLFSTFGVV